MSTRPRRPTSADVAARAGVSRATVSMVLDGRVEGTVAEATQQRVREAAAELGCTRSAVAVSLRERRTRTIGLITDEIATSPRSAPPCQTRAGVTWGALGHALACYEAALEHAGTRIQFGRPLAKAQHIQVRLASMLQTLTSMQLHCVRHRSDIEALRIYEGTDTMQSLIVGRSITGVSAFA
ncbi:hypothetical protein CFK38_03660 [Brachybacterium vulturis]|uniref:HTH lacI-type domain-containing protein n=1 Tax=Brachybacterium vulturis TaxID=2017484 RepID=A0A291GKI0_9MICO|nr:hypothetical protein CFK38_03660 [Brachybacterium vulturis]